MNIVVASAFRNSTSYLTRYFEQLVSLHDKFIPGTNLRLVAGEGDSTDGTARMLTMNAHWTGIPLQLLDVSHEGPVFGSTESPVRFKALSKICNALFESVTEYDDVLIYVESDLKWSADTLRVLVDYAICRVQNFDIFSPMVWAGPAFYDIWGFRKDNVRFSPFSPYHDALRGKLIAEVDSVGSCLVMRGEVARACRVRNDYCLVGWCEDARAHGYKIAVCTELGVHQL